MVLKKKIFDISTFWHGSYLRPVDRLCLMSMIKAGHKVKLYSYEEIKNVPENIELCDAREVISYSVLNRLDPDFPNYRPQVTIAQFSDFFRVFLMKMRNTVWLDTDVYLVKPFKIDPTKVWLAYESKKRLGVSAFYLPVNNPIIKEFENYLESDNILPNWLGFKRGVLKPLYFQIKRIPITPNRIGITVFGNDGISRLAKKYNFFSKAHAKETFYYWHARKSERIFDPKYGLEPLKNKNFLGFHMHYKELTKKKPLEGSFYHWAVQRIPEFQDYR